MRLQSKRVFMFIVAVMFLFSTTTITATTKSSITVHFRNQPNEVKWMNTVKTKFELLNPDIQIELVASPPAWAYNERLSILIASGNAPDVFYGAADKSSYILNGWAMDITDLLNRDRVEMGLNDFFPGVFDASTRMGRRYGVPAMAMSQALFYNKTLFDEVGLAEPPSDWNDKKWNWDAFMAAAKKLTRLGADGRTNRVALTYVRVEDLAWMFGGDWFPKEAYETNIATHSTLVSNENVAAYTAKQQLYVDLRATAVSPNSGIKSSTGFQQGLAAMDWGGWWKAGNYATMVKNGTIDFQWGIGATPLVLNRQNTRWTDPWFISSTSKHVEEAWRFIKYVTSQQSGVDFVNITSTPTAHKSLLSNYVEAISSTSGMNKANAYTALAGALEHSRPSIDEVIAGTAVVVPIINAEMTALDKGVTSARQMLEAAQAKVDAALKEFAARWQKK